jgi:hypothetical protein
MENKMHYKTMVHELVKSHPMIHDLLRRKRLLLPALDRYAAELKRRHDTLKDQLSQRKPGSDPSQISSEALEIALRELEDSFRSWSPTKNDDLLSLEEAVAFIRRRATHT